MSTDYTKLPVEQLLPHAGKMVLIDEILAYAEGQVTSRVRVSPQSLFFDAQLNGIHAAIGIEWMAQSIAAVAGITALQLGRPVQIGFLLGSRSYAPAKKVFADGEEYTISVRELYREDNGLGAFECNIYEGEAVIAESKLNVFAPDNVEEFLKGN